MPIANVTQADLPDLLRAGALTPSVPMTGEWWRLVSAMFLHIGLLHLIFNSWAFYQLGGLFETLFGTGRLVVTFFASGIIASIASLAFTRELSAGASGAIFGILGALIVALKRSPRWRNDRWSRSIVQQLLFWAGLNIFLGFSVDFIDNAAHLGGFAAGMLAGLMPHHEPPPPPSEMIIEHPPDRPVGP